jgi:adenylate kinase family enzyme
MVKIALLGAPGCGKSTLAAYVYAMLKDDGIDGELVTKKSKVSGSIFSFSICLS